MKHLKKIGVVLIIAAAFNPVYADMKCVCVGGSMQVLIDHDGNVEMTCGNGTISCTL